MYMQIEHTPLMIAAYEGQISVMKLLIAEKTCDVMHYQAIVSFSLSWSVQYHYNIIIG